MKMKTKRKALLLSLCAVLLVVASVMGTMAYLTAQTGEVKNTFTVGKIEIDLDEAKVDLNGKLVYEADGTTLAKRVQENEYKLIPGETYIKDPTVHVKAGSEYSYIFVEVTNSLADKFEAASVTGGYQTIADQIKALGWNLVEGTTNVYYKEYNAESGTEFKVFDKFKISDTANTVDGWGNNIAPITIIAYAVQKAGLADAKTAWFETYGKTTTTP